MEQVEDTINRLSAEIEELTAILLDDPLAEDVFVLEMRSVANPRFYVHPELRIATDEGREERFSLRRLVLGMGQEEGAFGGLIDLRYDPSWKQPVRELQFSGQFRAWGNRSTPLGLALGGTYLSYTEDYELLSEGSYTGVEKMVKVNFHQPLMSGRSMQRESQNFLVETVLSMFFWVQHKFRGHFSIS